MSRSNYPKDIHNGPGKPNDKQFGIYADLDDAFIVSDNMSEFENRVNKYNPLSTLHRKQQNSDYIGDQNDPFVIENIPKLSEESEEQINKNVERLLGSTNSSFGGAPETSPLEPSKNKLLETKPNGGIFKTIVIIIVIIAILVAIFYLAKQNVSESNNLSTNKISSYIKAFIE